MENRMIWNCEHCGQFMLEVGVLGTIERKDCGSCGKSNLVVLHKKPVTERDYRLLLKAAIKTEVSRSDRSVENILTEVGPATESRECPEPVSLP